METKNVIYLYKNKINGNMYIGQAVDFKSRHTEHRCGKGIRDNSRIDLAFQKYGEENFEIEILASAPNMDDEEARDYLNALEEYYIWKYNTFEDPDHYNLQPGGHNFGINENHPFWKDEARVIKGGFTSKGNQVYNLRYQGKVLRRSINKEMLQKICDEINNHKMDVHSREERAYVIKCGMVSNGKQNYGIKHKGKIIKNSIFKDKLEKICDEINLKNKFDIPENQLSINREAHVRKAGIATGEQRYAIEFDGKTLKTSNNKEELQLLCDEINTKGIEVFYQKEKENSKKDKAVIAKSGINRQGKQKYAVNYNGKTVKTSINKEKLEIICDDININGIEAFLEKKRQKKIKARLGKSGFRNGKRQYNILYNGKSIKCSVNKDELEKLCEIINTKGIGEFYKIENDKKNKARIVKHGFGDSGKQLYAIKYQKKIINVSVDKKKLEKICNEINSKIN
jgi:group I intron endonuclease